MRRSAMVGIGLSALVAGCGAVRPEEVALCQPLVETPLQSAAPTAPAHPSTILYLHRGGITLTGGSDDAPHGVSSLVAGRGLDHATLPAAPLDDRRWADVVACVQGQFARFDVVVVDRRPPTGDYLMAVFGGTGAELGYASDRRGAAPMDTAGCQTVPRAVVLVFSGQLGSDAQPHCETAAQEIAHTFSVDHELLAADPSSYLPFAGEKIFQDIDAPCGEESERACHCGRRSQNSVRLLFDRLGPSRAVDRDLTPPTVAAETRRGPRDGLAISVHADDAGGVATMTLTYRDAVAVFSSTCGDGLADCTRDGSTATFLVPGAHGAATFRATAVDRTGNVAATADYELIVDDADPDPTPIALGVATRGSFGRIVADAAITTTAGEIVGATLYWTDLRGVTLRRPLCRASGDRWSRAVEVAPEAGPRRYIIAAADSSGHLAVSPLQTFLYKP